MKIHDVAERLIALGIGKNKRKAIKSRLDKTQSERVKKELKNYIEKMLVRWAFNEGVIQKPEPYTSKNGIVELGRGKTSDWPPETVEQAAAVWAVRQKWREIHDGKKKRLSRDRIEVVKRAAAVLDERPFAVYKLPIIFGPLAAQRLAPETIKMNFVSEDCDGLDLFPGADNAKKAECLNKLVVTWIIAVEKVREWKSVGMLKCIVEYHPDLAVLAPEKIDFSQIDPWQDQVPCPWRIDECVRVTLYWYSRPSKNKESRVFWKPPFPFQRAFSRSDRDEIVLYENNIDTRKFFKIDFGDREEAERTELEKIDHEREKNERKLQSLNVDIGEISAGTVMAIEEKPIEKRTKEEKLVLETLLTELNLVKRSALLKTRR
jgi:hypothetical protein